MKYSVDTSAIIQAWRRYYPIDIFPSVWRRLEELVSNGDLGATEEVAIELEKKDDDVLAWVRRQTGMIVPLDRDVQLATRDILRDFPRLIDTRKNRSGADPFVIGLAMVEGITVVTDERGTGRADRPHIPDVCAALGISCIDVVGLIRAEGWQI